MTARAHLEAARELVAAAGGTPCEVPAGAGETELRALAAEERKRASVLYRESPWPSRPSPLEVDDPQVDLETWYSRTGGAIPME